jgi:hypothetical protein
MSKTTYGQLPGLQMAGKILELQEQINTHHRYATWLLSLFNQLQSQDYRQNELDHLQILCEWHGTQAMYLQIQLNELQSAS